MTSGGDPEDPKTRAGELSASGPHDEPQPFDARIEEVLSVIMRLARGDLTARAKLAEDDDEVTAIMVGLNMLAEELEHNEAERHRLAQEAKALQAKWIQAERLAALGQLAAGVGHEINNPLSYMHANLHYIADELGRWRAHLGAAADEIETAIGETLAGITRIQHIVSDLSALSRPSGDAHTQPLDVREPVEAAVRLLRNDIEQRAQLRRDYRDVPLVLANEARLVQVFVNLLKNATQAIPEGARATGEIHLVIAPAAPERVFVEIRDTGHGIPAEHLAKIFDPFFTTKDIGEGTGLGLSICYELITAMGGDITVASDVDAGTTFRIVLAAAPRHEPTRASVPKPGPQVGYRRGGRETGPGARILLIDDDVHVARALRRILDDNEVTMVTDGRAALRVIDADQAFDMILCDLMMPDVTGMDVYEHIARYHPALRDRVVFISGGAFTAQARAFVARTKCVVLNKPLDLNALQALIRARAPEP